MLTRGLLRLTSGGSPLRYWYKATRPTLKVKSDPTTIMHMHNHRHVRNKLQAVSQELPEVQRSLLLACRTALEVLQQASNSEHELRGPFVYVGRSGVALLYLRIAEAIRAGKLQQAQESPFSSWTPQHALENAWRHCQAAEAKSPTRLSHRITFLEGYPGVLAIKAAICAELGQTAAAQQAAKVLVSLLPEVSSMPSGECELLYGRTGYLYALLFARQYVGEADGMRAAIRTLIAEIVEAGKRGAASDPRAHSFGLMYQWHGKQYLGAAHGLCGICQVLLSCMEDVDAVYPSGEASALVEQAVEALIAVRYPSGNLPSSLDHVNNPSNDRLVQWCHGAPGLLPMLLTASQVFEEKRALFAEAAEQSSACIWERGLLCKGVGLCHGISGNAYALLSAYQLTGAEPHKSQAAQFGLLAARHWEELSSVPDAPASLFEGLAGAICLWIDLLHPETAKFPAYQL